MKAESLGTMQKSRLRSARFFSHVRLGTRIWIWDGYTGSEDGYGIRIVYKQNWACLVSDRSVTGLHVSNSLVEQKKMADFLLAP